MRLIDEHRRRVLSLKDDVPFVPSLLNFPSGNVDQDWIDLGDQHFFTGAFYVEVDFEYATIFDGWCGIIGDWQIPGQSFWSLGFRMLVRNATILISISSNLNNSISFSTSYNTRYTIRMRRDASNNIFFSVNGGAEIAAGTRAGNCYISSIGRENYIGSVRYLRGKVYGFDINGEQYNLTEGSGNKVYGSNGSVGTIMTTNSNGVDYINNDMWEPL